MACEFVALFFSLFAGWSVVMYHMGQGRIGEGYYKMVDSDGIHY